MPRVSRIARSTGWLAAFVMALAVTSPTTAAYAEAEAPRSADPARPVVLVHGWLGLPSNFDAMKKALTEAGIPAYTVLLLGQENVSNAKTIRAKVDEVSAAHAGSDVDLVGHSMGGLSTRYYLKQLGGTARVHSYVSMGTSQYGYEGACALPDLLGGQMCPGSDFLTGLNDGDDTPGSVSYTTMWSTEDTLDAARLDGGACFHEIAGVPHADEPKSPQFIAAVRAALAGTCPGEFVDLPIG